MNKIFLGLLIIAAGAATYFYLSKNGPSPNSPQREKPAIVGIWLPLGDTSDPLIKDQSIEFTHEGKLIHRQGTVYDTTFYSLTKEGNLEIIRSKEDTLKKNIQVLQLANDSLQIRGEDSVTILFRRWVPVD